MAHTVGLLDVGLLCIANQTKKYQITLFSLVMMDEALRRERAKVAGLMNQIEQMGTSLHLSTAESKVSFAPCRVCFYKN